MKKFPYTTAVLLFGLTQLASADNSTNTTPDSASCCSSNTTCCTTPDSAKPCPPACDKSSSGIRCGEKAWLDIETVTVESENGDPIAQYTIAYLTEQGDDTTKPDPEKAKEWYAKSISGLEKAAADGSATACCALAHIYAEGKGVEKNPELAEKYMKMCKELKAKKDKHCKPDTKCAPPAPAPAPEQN